MQPQRIPKAHMARKSQSNSKRAFNIPIVDLSKTQDASKILNVTGNSSQHQIVNSSSTSPLSTRYHQHHSHASYAAPMHQHSQMQPHPPPHQPSHSHHPTYVDEQAFIRRKDPTFIYESQGQQPLTARQSGSSSRKSFLSRKNSNFSSKRAVAVAALHYGRPINNHLKQNTTTFASDVIATIEQNMQKVRQSVYNRKKNIISSDLTVSQKSVRQHTPQGQIRQGLIALSSDGISPHPPQHNYSRDISPNAGAYPQPIHQTTTFANFSKNAHVIQQQQAIRKSSDLTMRNKMDVSPRGSRHQNLMERPNEFGMTQPLPTQHAGGGQGRNSVIGGGGMINTSSMMLMDSGGPVGGGSQGQMVMVHQSTERTKSYDRGAIAAGQNTTQFVKNSQKSFTGSSHYQDHTISVYDNKSRVTKSKTQTNSVTNATNLAKLRNKLTKDKQTIPLQPINFTALQSQEYKIREAKRAPSNNEGMAVFSNRGITLVGKGKNQPSDFISSESFIVQQAGRHIYGKLPFFQHFHPLKNFKLWRQYTCRARYQRKRQKLAKNFVFSKPMFSDHFPTFMNSMYSLQQLQCFDIHKKTVYGKKQQAMLDEKCNKSLDKAGKDVNSYISRLRNIVDSMKKLISKYDNDFEAKTKEEHTYKIVQKKKYDELILFSQDRRAKFMQDENKRQLVHRRKIFNSFIQLMLRVFSQKLIRMIYDNTANFFQIFTGDQGPQFQLAIVFSNKGKITTDPTIKQHREIFENLFLRLDNLIFQNKRIFQFVQHLNSSFFPNDGSFRNSWNHKRIFHHIVVCLNSQPQYKQFKENIFSKLEKDSSLAHVEIKQYIHLEEIYQFVEQWKLANGGSVEGSTSQSLTLQMGYYKQTWARMDKYTSWIDKIPNYNTHINSIQVQTVNLRNFLSKLPKDIMKALRHNVTATMETETKTLKGELVGKVMKTLERVPTDLNQFVKQIDMVKYVQLKAQDYEQRNNSINKLYTLCKNDNIRVAPSLQIAIDDVQRLYEGLPAVLQKAKKHLAESKDNIEIIMLNSTLTLSKKIKAFQKRYVENYLQMPERLNDPTGTLQELIRRNNFQSLNQIHRTTSNLWKMLTYWAKRKEAFLSNSLIKVDLYKIRHSIQKMVKFFQAKIDIDAFIRDKSRKLVNKVKIEIKQIASVLEFFRDLKKDSLRVRHWVQILNFIKRPQLINVQFSISDLRNAEIQNYQTEIRDVINNADKEYQYEQILTDIKGQWKKLELTVVPYKQREQAYIITDSEAIFAVIDEHMTTLENAQHSLYAVHVREDIRSWITNLKIMEALLEKWIDTQKLWINLEPIFSTSKGLLNQILINTDERLQFDRINDSYMKIMWAAYRNPKATFSLLSKNKLSSFDDLLEYLRKIQTTVDQFMESRRLAFPRFFFLSDLQFLQFLSLVHQRKDFNEFIPILFPGANSLFLSRALQTDIPTMHHDPTTGLEMSINASQDQLASQIANLPPESIQDKDGDPAFKRQTLWQAKDFSRKNSKGEKRFNQMTMQQQFHQQSVTTENMSIQNRKHSPVKDPSKIKHPQILELDSSQILGSANSSIILQNYATLQGRGEIDDHTLLAHPHQILGFVSEHRQLFMFQKQVMIQNDRPETWLSAIQSTMQETVGKNLHYAVSSFPKQSLDQWILDFPLQTILSTIHLILTHQINDLFEGMMKALHSMGGQHYDDDEDDDDQYSLDSDTQNHQKTPRTPDTRNLLKSSNALSSKSSATGTRHSRGVLAVANALPTGGQQSDDQQHSSNYRKKSVKKIGGNLTREESDMGSQANRRSQVARKTTLGGDEDSELDGGNRTNRSYEDDDQEQLSQYEVNLQLERNRFASNMFGSQIDDSVIGKTKSDTIKALQEKSFKGLYMRLQFWIKQIQKSLYEHTLNSDFQLPELQRHSLRTIITFLIYMRDVVNSLRKRGISNPQDNQWLQHIRLTCQQHQKMGCKVDCGSWSMQQANEYVGTSIRLLITPETNKYFVHISAALREKSAVLMKCIPSHDTSQDIVKQFASICTVPFKSIMASEDMQMKLLMQFLNGAALASVWIFVEHMDRLRFEILQTFNKQIQMVQQQFIIAELSNNEQSLFNTGSLRMGGGPQSQQPSPVKEANQAQNQNESSIPNQPQSSHNIQDRQQRVVRAKEIAKAMASISMSSASVTGGANDLSMIGKSKTCFGVFGSLSYGYQHRVMAGKTALTVTALSTMQKAKDLKYTLSSAFRILQLQKIEPQSYLVQMLYSHGFKNPRQIARVYESFFHQIQTQYLKLRGNKMKILYLSRERQSFLNQQEQIREQGMEVFSFRASSTNRSQMRRKETILTSVQQHHDLITPNMRDMTVIVKLLSSLYTHNVKQFLKQRQMIFKENEPVMPTVEKKTKTKMMEKMTREHDQEKFRNQRIQKIEVDCLRKILQLFGQQRFFWLWKRELDDIGVQQKSKDKNKMGKSYNVDGIQTPQLRFSGMSKGAEGNNPPTGLKRATSSFAATNAAGVPGLQAALSRIQEQARAKSSLSQQNKSLKTQNRLQDAQIIYKLSKSIAKCLRMAFLSQDAKISETFAAFKQVEESPSVVNLGDNATPTLNQPNEAAQSPQLNTPAQVPPALSQKNIGSTVSLISSGAIMPGQYHPKVQPQDMQSIEALAAAPLAELMSQIEKSSDPLVIEAINECYDSFFLVRNKEQQSKAFMLYSALRTYKLISIVGPPCSGKSTLISLLSGALLKARNIPFRKAHLVPNTLENSQFFGVSRNGDIQQGALSVILRTFQQEQDPNTESPRPINCLLLDGQIQPPWADAFLSFTKSANHARNGISSSITDNLGERSGLDQINHINLPNGTSIPLPASAYIFFETLTLSNATPAFVDSLCVISCDSDNLVDWRGVLKKALHGVYQSQPQLFNRHNNLDFGSLQSTAQSFLLPIVNKSPLKIKQWRFWNMKLIALSFAQVLRGLIRALMRTHQDLINRDEPIDIDIAGNAKLILQSLIVSGLIWSIGCMLPGAQTGQAITSVGQSKAMDGMSGVGSGLSDPSIGLKKMFDQFIRDQLKRFLPHIPVQQDETVFDYYFDPEKLEFLPFRYSSYYTLKPYYDQRLSKLVLSTQAVTSALYMGDLILRLQNRSHLFLCGAPASQKSTIMYILSNEFKREKKIMTSNIPVSAALTLSHMKQHIESFYYNKRKNVLIPKDEKKSVVFMIDDLHLSANFTRTNFSEFFRSWSTIAGYYDINLPGFKQIKDFSLLISANTSYGHDFVPGAISLKTGVDSNRFLHSHVCTMFLDSVDADGTRYFFQHWLTSNQWMPSEFINHYYVLITGALLNLHNKLSHLKSRLSLPQTQLNKLSSFHFFSRFCQNMARFSILNNFRKQSADKDIAFMLAHEISRVWGDRIPIPACKSKFFDSLHGMIRSQLLVPTITPQVINTIKIGHFHKLDGQAMPKYFMLKDVGTNGMNQSSDEAIAQMNSITQQLKELCQSHTNDKYLESFAELPLTIENVWKISRCLYKHRSHLILVGPAGIGKRQCLQLATLLQSAMIIEPLIRQWGDPSRFLFSLRQAITQAVKARQNVVFLISDLHLQDLVYIDILNAYLNNPDCDDVLIMDKNMRQKLIKWQREEYLSNPRNIKYSGTQKEPRREMLMMDINERIRKYFHIVITMSSTDQYVSWIGRFPGLETHCDVIFMNEPGNDKYVDYVRSYLKRRDTSKNLWQDESLGQIVSFTRTHVRNYIRFNYFKQGVDPATLYQVDNSEHLGEVNQLPIRYKIRRPRTPAPSIAAIKSQGMMSGGDLRKEIESNADKQSEVKYTDDKNEPKIDLNEIDRRGSLAQDSKQSSSHADDTTPAARTFTQKKRKNKKKRRKTKKYKHQRSQSFASSQNSDSRYETPDEGDFNYQNDDDDDQTPQQDIDFLNKEIIKPQDEQKTQIESDHMSEEILRTLMRNKHVYDRQRIEQLLRNELFPTLNMPSQFVSNYRFIMMLQLFRFFYDYFSISLLVRRNYYSGYLKRSQEFNEWFIKLGNEKYDLQSENKNLLVQLVTLRAQIKEVKQSIADKAEIIKQKNQQIRSAEVDVNIARKEIKRLTRDKQLKMAEAMKQIEKSRPGQLTSLAERILAQKITDLEARMLSSLVAMLELDFTLANKFPGRQLANNLANKADLLQILRFRLEDQADHVPPELLKSVKPFIQDSEPQQFSGILLPLCHMLFEWFRKVNLPNSLSSVYEKRDNGKKIIGQNQLAISYANHFIEDAKIELNQLQQRQEMLQGQTKYVSKEIQDAEVQHVRTIAIINTIRERSAKSQQKLKKINDRIQHLLGDCIILAATVCFMGPFSLTQRISLRNDLAIQIMLNQQLQDASDCWRSENTTDEDASVQIFRDIIEQLGYQNLFHQIRGSINQGYFSELLFMLIFAANTPVIYDSIGEFQKFVKAKLQPNASMLFASDLSINSRIEQVLKSTTPAQLFDLNDFSMQKFHKTSDTPLLSRLSYRMVNGIDQKVAAGASGIILEPSLYHKSSLHNNKIPMELDGVQRALSLHKISIYSAQPRFDLNPQYASRATIINVGEINKNQAWMEIKQIFLKHFLPQKYQSLIYNHDQIVKTRQKLAQLQRTFETLFLLSDEDTLRKVSSFEALKSCVQAIRATNEQLDSYMNEFNTIINQHPLLASYANIFVIFFIALKQLSKLTGQVAYSWSSYLKIIDLVINKLLRDLTLDHERNVRKKNKNAKEAGQQAPNAPKDFTIEDDFFHSSVMPALVSTVCAGIRQENYPIFTLLFAFEIGIKKGTIEDIQREFFLKHFLVLQNFRAWRREDTHFFKDVLADQTFNKPVYEQYQAELAVLYPKQAPFLFGKIEKELGEEKNWTSYLNIINKKYFCNGGQYHYLDTLKKVNISLIAPDDQFKSRLAQFVHQELHPIFDYQFEAPKLHNFIKTASWNLPIALFTSNSINIVNTVCSIASFYSVGLEVVRTDTLPSIEDKEGVLGAKQCSGLMNDPNFRGSLYHSDRLVPKMKGGSSQLTKEADKIRHNLELENQYPGEYDCRRVIGQDPAEWQRIPQQRQSNMRQAFIKDSLVVDNKSQGQMPTGVPHQVTLDLIEKCALNGTWVLISTFKFPSFWYKMATRLEELAKQGKIINSFRLFVDLQGFSQAEIPASFLFNYCVRFFLTDENNEDMEGFNDIWAHILNNDILDKDYLKRVTILDPQSVLNQLKIDTNINEDSIDMLMPKSTKIQNYNKSFQEQKKEGHEQQKKKDQEEKDEYKYEKRQGFDYSAFKKKSVLNPDILKLQLEGLSQDEGDKFERVKEIQDISAIIQVQRNSLLDITNERQQLKDIALYL